MDVVLREALIHGAWLSVGMTALILVSLRHDPEAWLNDYPPDIRAAHGPMSARARRHGRRWAIVCLVLLVAVFARLFARLAAHGVEMSFGTCFLAAYVTFSVFNLVDLVVIDLGIMLGLRPRWAVLPGTDPASPGYSDPWFHVRGFFVGCVLGAGVAALAAGLAVLFVG
ncbi:hypothetical protein SAMN02745121_02963 [Nannocystis exedens]|uniref:Uncharacterized protein n=1 Tax=Nannocystis exedens TaxID=54 RepID=A0A1I1XMN6_9BACT|nr:hypothetical protein [Nannocystis exedens]PCC73309.1 hypothetical protein NAEX_06397 [Nannocystis exedens]SFE08639.1 hypothetical protein SAMN02745121_02963 [Nannocystis exedens]